MLLRCTRPGRRWWLAAVVLLLLSGPCLLTAQPTERGDHIDVQFGTEGVSLEQAIDWARQTTGRAFQYNEAELQSKPAIMMAGMVSIPKDRIYEFWQAVFVTQGFAMVPLGPGEGDFILIEPIDTARHLKQRSTYVPAEELRMVRGRVGQVVMTTIRLRHVNVNNVRGAVQALLENRQAEFAQEVVTANSLVVVAFAPTAYALYQILLAMDVPSPELTLRFEILSLRYAVATELQPLIADLISSATQPGASVGARGINLTEEQVQDGIGAFSAEGLPEPKVIAEPRTNALIVYAIQAHLDEIKRLVATLDIDNSDLTSELKIYFLKNTDATDLERTLRDILGQSPGLTGGRAGGTPGTIENVVGEAARDVVIVAHAPSNALVIRATRTQYETLEPLIVQLDKRRPQVLVHAAIAELTEADVQAIAVELTGVEGGDDRYRFGAGTQFGLSTITFDETVPGPGQGGGGGNTMGSGQGTSGSNPLPDISRGLIESLVRIPFATGTGIGFTGLAAGIIRDGFNVPFLVSLLETHTTARLITNASVLTNDNQQSTIEVGQTINIIRTESSQSPTVPGRVTAGEDLEANLTLAISPRISNDNYLRLDIELVVEAFQGQGDPSLNIPPPRTRRSFSGSVTVPNGRTVVIGGLVQQDSVQSVSMVPFLGEIPIIGELFKSTTDSHTNTTLYLFVTPTIIKDFRLLDEISYARKLELFKLNGDIRLVDPDFRVRGIEDFDVDLESLEQTGMLDMPNYQPMTPISEGAKTHIPSR